MRRQATSFFILHPKRICCCNTWPVKILPKRRDAYNALGNTPFTEKDREALQEAVFKTYQSLYDSSADNTINNNIAEKLAALKSNATVDFVKSPVRIFYRKKRHA